jgi:hypothetical protein
MSTCRRARLLLLQLRQCMQSLRLWQALASPALAFISNGSRLKLECVLFCIHDAASLQPVQQSSEVLTVCAGVGSSSPTLLWPACCLRMEPLFHRLLAASLCLTPSQGTYVYFDYNIMHDDLQTGWCYRRKENFTFRCEQHAVPHFLQLCAARISDACVSVCCGMACIFRICPCSDCLTE